MEDFAKAIRYSHETRLIDDWFTDFISQHDLEAPYGNEDEIKLFMAVKILQKTDVVSRKLESGTLSQLAKLMRETPVIEEQEEDEHVDTENGKE
jgi:hypothetical protein